MSVSRLARHKVGYSSSFFISVRGGGGGEGGEAALRKIAVGQKDEENKFKRKKYVL